MGAALASSIARKKRGAVVAAETDSVLPFFFKWCLPVAPLMGAIQCNVIRSGYCPTYDCPSPHTSSVGLSQPLAANPTINLTTTSMASPSISAPPPLPSSLVPTVTPASLSSLAIYNPSLGSTDSTLHNQLIFYTSRRGNAAISTNDKLRQIGLAQGIAEFARGFSSTDNCTSVETQRSRVVTLELEDGWWIHAAIDLTCLHNPTVQPPTQEWSSREVAPTQLLVAQIKRAYSQYRFLYGRFQMGWEKLERAAFCKRVEKFWLRWAWVRWEVVLHGSPVIDMLAEKTVNMAGGRLGKEEIGRQEKEFMEGWIRKESAHGLVDMVVSRFGEREVEAAPEDASPTRTKSGSPFWFWNPHRRSDSSSTKDPNKNTEDLPPVLMPSDGCVFKGIGAVEVNDVASYLSELYEKAEETYVVTGNGVRRKRRRKRPRDNSRLGVSSGESSPRRSTSTIRHAREDGPKPTNSGLGRNEPESPEVQPSSPISPDAALEAATPSSPPDAPPPADDPPPLQPAACDDSSLRFRNLSAANGKILNLLTFGWSSRVQSGSTSAPSEAGDGGDTDSVFGDASAPATSTTESEKKRRGAFLIGFQGDLELEDIDDDHEDSSGRITSRTVWLPRTPPSDSEEAENAVPHPLSEFKLVVYTVHPLRPPSHLPPPPPPPPPFQLTSLEQTLHLRLPLRATLSHPQQPKFLPLAAPPTNTSPLVTPRLQRCDKSSVQPPPHAGERVHQPPADPGPAARAAGLEPRRRAARAHRDPVDAAGARRQGAQCAQCARVVDKLVQV